MGGGGSMMAANQALKRNRAMLSQKKRGKFSLATDGTTTWEDPKKATPVQLQEIRTRIQQEKKRRIRRTVSVVFAGLFLLVVGYILIVSQL